MVTIREAVGDMRDKVVTGLPVILTHRAPSSHSVVCGATETDRQRVRWALQTGRD